MVIYCQKEEITLTKSADPCEAAPAKVKLTKLTTFLTKIKIELEVINDLLRYLTPISTPAANGLATQSNVKSWKSSSGDTFPLGD